MAVHGEDFVILVCVVLSVVDTISECDGRTDASTMTKTREALHAVARKNGKVRYLIFLLLLGNKRCICSAAASQTSVS